MCVKSKVFHKNTIIILINICSSLLPYKLAGVYFLQSVPSVADLQSPFVVISALQRECVTRFSTTIFYDSNPSGPLIYRVKYLRIWFRFRRDIQICKKLCSVHHIAESDSAVCIIPKSQTLQYATHHGVMKAQYLKKTPWFASHRGVRLRGVLPSAESSSAVCITPRYIGNLRSVDPISKCILPSDTLHFNFCTVKCLLYTLGVLSVGIQVEKVSKTVLKSPNRSVC